MKITLGSGEMAMVRTIAMMRRYANDIAGIKDRSFSRDSFAEEINGLVAEMAFAKYCNVYPDLLGRPRGGSHDCTVRGRRVDVKSVTQASHQLITPVWKATEPADIYVLGIVTENEVDFVGYARGDEFICDETLTDLGHGPTYVLSQSKLRKFKQDSEQQEEVSA